MIDKLTADKIRKKTQAFWSKEVKSSVFRKIAQGKEIGHRIADFVDDQTTALLTRSFTTKYQYNKNGGVATRSMGDVWLKWDKIYHPINVKSGVVGVEGQPNMVSLAKLLNALICHQIDAYYLLMVKVEISDNTVASVYFVDMLDHLEYVTFDSGPGQIMLKAKAFFQNLNNGDAHVPRTVTEKVNDLMNLLEDGERRLASNRKKRLSSFRNRVKEYRNYRTHLVTPETQESLNLQ